MALSSQNTLVWHKWKLEIRDPSVSPPVFSTDYGEPCILVTRGLTFDMTPTETAVPACDDPGGAVWVVRNAQSQSATIEGTGYWEDATFDTIWRPWIEGSVANPDGVFIRTIRLTVDESTAASYGFWQGDFIWTQMAFTADRDAEGGLVQASVSLASTGKVEWTSL